MSDDISHTATLGSKQHAKFWAMWRAKNNTTLIEFAEGPARVQEEVGVKETHKLVVPTNTGAREQYISIDFRSTLAINVPQTADGVEQGRELTREMLIVGHQEWMEAIRSEVLTYARERLAKGL